MRRALPLALAASLVTGCALVSGLSDLDVGDAPLDAAADAARDVAPDRLVDATADVSTDAGSEADAPSDAPADVTDAATCTVSGSDFSTITSTCIAANPNFQGGTIPSASYALTDLYELKGSCSGYVAFTASGRLNVQVQGGTFTIEERVTINGVPTERRYTGTVSGSTMTLTQLCGPAAPTKWQLYVDVVAGKTLVLALKAGQPTQRFYWLQQ